MLSEVLGLSNVLLVVRATALAVVVLRSIARVDEHPPGPMVTVLAFVLRQRGRKLRQLADCSLELLRLLLVLLLVLAFEESASVQELQLLQYFFHQVFHLALLSRITA
jgi:hypothetical protein